MSDAPAPLPRDFIALADRALAAPLSPEEQAAFERHLLNTPGAMAHYLRLAEVDALLPDALALAAAPRNVVRPAPSLWRRHRISLTTSALAACLALAAGAAFLSRDAGAPEARITRTVALRRAGGETSDGLPARTRAGSIDAGFLELTLDSGVRLLLEGPARYAVTGKNAVRLDYGKAFADVPRGAEGFTLQAPRERIIDHGTRFAVAVTPDGASTTVGVVSGEVEVRHAGKQVRLYTDYALRRDGDTLATVPFDKSLVAAEPPSREFPWSLDDTAFGATKTIACDVSRLVTGPGDFRAVFKWLNGPNAATIRRVSLERDGQVVAVSHAPGVTGLIGRTAGNSPVLHLATADFAEGASWRLVADLAGDDAHAAPADRVKASGIVSFESDLALRATAGSFVGRWRYTHGADTFVREFRRDGTMRMEINGKHYPGADGATYTVTDGILTVRTPQEGHLEEHMLRDDGTLVFLNRPYRNAHRE